MQPGLTDEIGSFPKRGALAIWWRITGDFAPPLTPYFRIKSGMMPPHVTEMLQLRLSSLIWPGLPHSRRQQSGKWIWIKRWGIDKFSVYTTTMKSWNLLWKHLLFIVKEPLCTSLSNMDFYIWYWPDPKLTVHETEIRCHLSNLTDCISSIVYKLL